MGDELQCLMTLIIHQCGIGAREEGEGVYIVASRKGVSCHCMKLGSLFLLNTLYLL